MKVNSELDLGGYIVINSSLISNLYFSNISLSFFQIYIGLVFIYAILYAWRNLSFSLDSFIAFLLNGSFFILFIFGFYNLYKGFPKPIYVEDLSLFSYYRYMTFLLITVLGILVYFLFKNYTFMLPFIKWINYPYLKEQTRIFLNTWENAYLGDICCKLLDSLMISRNMFIFFSIHFLISYFLCVTFNTNLIVF